MLRNVRFGLAIGVLLALGAGDAQAQYYRYGWGGWGGGVGSLPGDIARGLGYYDIGAGIYNEQTAEANAINEATIKDWNNYMYLSQQEANRHEYLRMARREKRDAASGDLILQRLRENPSERDIRDGDALNVILDQLTDPRIHTSVLRLATDPISSDVVRTIPFVNASEAVTISLDQLSGKDGWPLALRSDRFAEERKAYEEAVDEALKEDEEGNLKPETVEKVRTALRRLYQKFEASPPEDKIQRVDAENHFRTLFGMIKMLENPQVEQIIAELEKVPRTSLGSLLGFMHTYNLRFGPARTPRQEAVYNELYTLLAAYRDRIMKDLKDGAPIQARGNRPPSFFQGMRLDRLSGTSSPPPREPK
jgi:hypothetical protein